MLAHVGRIYRRGERHSSRACTALSPALTLPPPSRPTSQPNTRNRGGLVSHGVNARIIACPRQALVLFIGAAGLVSCSSPSAPPPASQGAATPPAAAPGSPPSSPPPAATAGRTVPAAAPKPKVEGNLKTYPAGFVPGQDSHVAGSGRAFLYDDARDGSGAISHIVDGIGGQNVDRSCQPAHCRSALRPSSAARDRPAAMTSSTSTTPRRGLPRASGSIRTTSSRRRPGRWRLAGRTSSTPGSPECGSYYNSETGATATGEVGSKGPVMQRAFPAGTLLVGLTHLVAVSPHDSLELSLTKTRIFGYNQRTGSAVVVGFSDWGTRRP